MEMPGVSISLIPLDAERDALFDHPTAAMAWPTNGRVPADPVRVPRASKVAEPASNVNTEPFEVDSLRRIILAVADALDAAEPELTDLDSKVGDGDLGASMQRGAEAARNVAASKWASTSELLVGLALALRRAIAGSSGPFYAVALIRAASILEQRPHATPDAIVEAFAGAVASVSELGGARPGDRTMLDALAPALAVLQTAVAEGKVLTDGVALAAAAASAGAAHTAELMPTLGRSSYLGTRALGVPDGGARAVAIWLEAIARSLRSA
jgi:dihydroxyacetone kinase